MGKKKKEEGMGKLVIAIFVTALIFVIAFFATSYVFNSEPQFTITENVCEEKEVSEEVFLNWLDYKVLEGKKLEDYKEHKVRLIYEFDADYFFENLCWSIIGEIYPNGYFIDGVEHHTSQYPWSIRPNEKIIVNNLLCYYHLEKFVEIGGKEELVEYMRDKINLRDFEVMSPNFSEDNVTFKILETDKLKEKWGKITNYNKYWEVLVDIIYENETICSQVPVDEIEIYMKRYSTNLTKPSCCIGCDIWEDNLEEFSCLNKSDIVKTETVRIGAISKQDLTIEWLDKNVDECYSEFLDQWDRIKGTPGMDKGYCDIWKIGNYTIIR